MRGVFVSMVEREGRQVAPGLGRYAFADLEAGVTHEVVISCRLPALYLEVFEYEFATNVAGEVTYLNKFLGWKRRELKGAVSEIVINRGNMQAENKRLRGAAPGEYVPEEVRATEVARAWFNFDDLLALRRISDAPWSVVPDGTLKLLRAGDFYGLMQRVRLSSTWLHARTKDDRLCADVDFYNFVVDSTADNPVVADCDVTRRHVVHSLGHGVESKERLQAKGMLVLDAGICYLPWAHAMLDEFRVVFLERPAVEVDTADALVAALAQCAYVVVPDPQPDALDRLAAAFGSASVYPELAPVILVKSGHDVSLRRLLDIGAGRRFVVEANVRRGGDAFNARRDLPAHAVYRMCATVGVAAQRAEPRKTAELKLARARAGQVATIDDHAADARYQKLKVLLQPEDMKEPRRALFVFCYDAPAEMLRYAAFRTGNWICTQTQADCLKGRVAHLSWKNKKPSFACRGVSVRYAPGAFLPLAVCREAAMLALEPADFDVVVLFRHGGTSDRWTEEALRLGSGGTVILVGSGA